MELVLDFETKDQYIEEGLGSGWPFYSEGRLKVLCAAYKIDQQQEEVTEDMSFLLDLVSKASTIICHNVNYDVGLLHALGADYSEAIIVDTIQLAKLNNNNLFDYSLDTLSKEFFNESKTSDKLGQLAVELGLVKLKTQSPVTVAMRNIDVLYTHDPALVQSYAKQDVALTYKLYHHLKISEDKLKFYSDLNKAIIQARAEGVRVDLNRAKEVHEILTSKMDEVAYVIEDMAPGVNVNSSKQLAEYFTQQGVEFPATDKGNPSITKEFLATCPHPIAQAINKFKKYEKAVRDFTQPIIDGGRDRVYPELKVFGAAATGRMSCACVPMDTLALTRNGWKLYDELVVGEDVLAYDLESGTKKWTPLLAKNKYKDQEVGSMGTDIRKVRCTANHTWVHKGHGTREPSYKLRRADEFKLNDGYLVNAPYEADGSFDIPELNSINKYQSSLISAVTRFSEQELRKFVLGFLLADGHFLNATKIGTKQTWQFTQVHGKILEELVIATYLAHSGRVGITNHHKHKNPNHRMTSRAVFCHSPHSTIRHVWKPESIEDVWCPTTKYGTWVMRQGDVITITGNSPNIQQIPKRDEEVGPLVRSIYLPEVGEQWYSLDFSSQEPRLQIHFAKLLNAPGVEELVEKFHANPKYDLHKWTAALIFGVSEANVSKDQRNIAKTINLGLAYGMGVGKLAESLHLPVSHAQNLLKDYHVRVPFMKYLTSMCGTAIRRRGFIKTLGDRLVKDDGFSHKALNKLIQGSASDQTYTCLVELYRRGIKFKFPIHDSIEISAKDPIIIKEVKEVMETIVKLCVPSVTDVEGGDTWGSLEKVEIL